MGLIERLKGSYRNGREKRRLLRKKKSYDSKIDRYPSDSETFYDRIAGIYQKLNAIPKPRGLLEEIVYTLGGI